MQTNLHPFGSALLVLQQKTKKERIQKRQELLEKEEEARQEEEEEKAKAADSPEAQGGSGNNSSSKPAKAKKLTFLQREKAKLHLQIRKAKSMARKRIPVQIRILTEVSSHSFSMQRKWLLVMVHSETKKQNRACVVCLAVAV